MPYILTAKGKISLIGTFISCCFFIVVVALFVRCFVPIEDNAHFSAPKYEKYYPALLLDRNLEMIAVNVPTLSVYTFTKKIEDDLSSIAERLSSTINLDKDLILKKLTSKSSFVWLKRHLVPYEQEKVFKLGIPGLYFEKEKRRVYLLKNLFAHVVGYSDNDNLGIGGIEYQLFSNKVQDKTVRLSLDIRIQHLLRDELQKTITKFQAIAGFAMISDVNTGEIIAMVSLPDFDPNYVRFASEEQKFNRVTMGRYEFGSIMKLFTVACALESGYVTKDTLFDVEESIQIGKFKIKDYYRPKKRYYSVEEILQYSSNIGVVKVAREMGVSTHFDCFEHLGFFDKVKLEIPEVTTPLRVKESQVTSFSMSYGYSFAPTLLHVLRALSSIINDTGCLPKMTILRTEGQQNCEQPIMTPETRYTMRDLMSKVVADGTGKRAAVKGYKVGGKTGSSNKNINGIYLKDKAIASFIATFPMENPKYVIGIIIDEPKASHAVTGGVVSAPVAKRVIEGMIGILGILPDNLSKTCDTKIKSEIT